MQAFHPPECGDFCPVLGVGNFAMTGEECGHTTGFTSAHGIGLSGQTERTGARSANLSGGQMQVDESNVFIGAMAGLIQALTPEGKGGGRLAEGYCRGTQVGNRNGAGFRYPLRGIVLHPRLEFFPALSMGLNKGPVQEPFPDQNVQHAVKQRHIGARLNGQKNISDGGGRCAPRIDNDNLQFRAA